MPESHGEYKLLVRVAKKEREVESMLIRVRADAGEAVEEARREAAAIIEQARTHQHDLAEELGRARGRDLRENTKKEVREVEQLIEFITSLSDVDIDKHADELLREVFPEYW